MNIVITGASRGIGSELSKILSQDGDHNIIIISRNIQKLNLLKNECEKMNAESKITAIEFNLENISSIEALAKEIERSVKCIDILINNAGYLVNKPFDALTISDTDKIYKINVLAPIELIRKLLPLLKRSRNAHVVNISSMGGFQGTAKFSGLSSYASSKAAIASLTECLAEEYKHTTLKFNCLALGAVATEMLAEAFPGYEAPTTANEMATFIAQFALSGHTMFNGKILPVSKTTP